MMKKILLAAALGFVSVGSFGQTFEETEIHSGGRIESIPLCYSKDAKQYLISDDYYAKRAYIYDESLSLVKSFSLSDHYAQFDYYDCRNMCSETRFAVTQTLFNDDDAFEFLEKIVAHVDGKTRYSGVRIMSDEGRELARIMFGKPVSVDVTVSLIRIGEKDLIFFDDEENFRKVYTIEKGKGSQTSIREVPEMAGIFASPSLARRNQSVDIQLGEQAGGRLMVTAANGAVVRQVPITRGQKSVQLNTRGLSAGVYVVSMAGDKGTQENCKIVIR